MHPVKVTSVRTVLERLRGDIVIDLNAIIRRNPDWKVNALGSQDQQDIQAMISELLFYVPKCSKCGDHLGLLAESACPKCRLTAEVSELKAKAYNRTLFINSIMTDLKRSKMDHGLCKPVERNSCTACAAQRNLDEAVELARVAQNSLPPLPDNQDSYYPCKRMMLQEQPYRDCFPAENCDGCDCWRQPSEEIIREQRDAWDDSSQPPPIGDCKLSVRMEQTEDGELFVGRCPQYPDVTTFHEDVGECFGLLIDAVQTLSTWDDSRHEPGESK